MNWEESVSDTSSVRPGQNLIVAMPGHIDAASATQRLGSTLAASLSRRTLARFDSDALYDLRTRPSTALLQDSHFTQLSLPSATLAQCTDMTGTDFLLLTGMAPDFGWLSFSRDVMRAAQQLDVSSVWCLQSVPWLVPHTRPVSVWAVTPDAAMRARHRTPKLDIQVQPAPIEAVLQVAGAQLGVPVHIAVARVPQYLGRYPYSPAVAALTSFLEQECGLVLPAVPDDAGLESLLSALWVSSPALAMALHSLERAYDGEPVGDSEVSGDLLDQIERYLEEQGESGE